MRHVTHQRGLSLIELLLSASVVAMAAMTAVAYVTRAAQHADWTTERVYARQKALSILAELRGFVESGAGDIASDLDGFDDGGAYLPSLTIAEDPRDPGTYLDPADPASGNTRENGGWRWSRKITIRPLPGTASRDIRVCTVELWRVHPEEAFPGQRMAELSTVIRTIGEASASAQTYDVYLLAIENAPGWWTSTGAMQPLLDATLSDIESRNPGLAFRTHWITRLGYGRDEEYAPFTNRARDSTEDMPWTYVYPGTLPAGEAAGTYYDPAAMRARLNVDGMDTPAFAGDLQPQEAYTDANGNGRRDPGEAFVDGDDDQTWDVGNEVPYALADIHNHCMRYPEAVARFEERRARGLEDDAAPSWRLLLDRMAQDPGALRNAIFVNVHGALLPMPPTRNVSDAAADPERHPGWRVVAHPERIGCRRVPGDDASSVAPRFRVHAWKSEWAGEAGASFLMTQEEPFADANRNGRYDAGEDFRDWNANGRWDEGVPMSFVIRDGDFTGTVNATADPSMLVERLPGGIDADGDGVRDAYRSLEKATRYPEPFADGNGNGIREHAEVFLDLDGNGVRDPQDPHQEMDGNGVYSSATETLEDGDGDGVFDAARPAEPFDDANGNGRWDGAEPYWDRNGNGKRDLPVASPRPPYAPWNPLIYGIASLEAKYVSEQGEPFLDLDGDETWDDAETFYDGNGNGVRDGGFERGEMWFEVVYDATEDRTVLLLHGTPLETPEVGGSGLPVRWRLYDMDHIPCPTPDTAAGWDRYARDLAWSGDAPKNTARWRITLPVAAVREAFASAPGAGDGDAADRIVAVESRIGTDLTTGILWPDRRSPRNRSTTYTWFCDDPEDIPFSERHQFLGDARHCPYEDLDRTGTTAPNGYNWYWDDLESGKDDARGAWLAFDAGRLRDRWQGRADVDVARYFQWLRTALVRQDALWTSLTGFSFSYLSVGGDVGSHADHGFSKGIPMDGMPFGDKKDVYENTLSTTPGTPQLRGSRKLVISDEGKKGGIRGFGAWWSKPWLGELCPDTAYGQQWVPWGNLRAGKGAGEATFHLGRKSDVPSDQVPFGSEMQDAIAETGDEGCTSFFNIGSSGATFHHQDVVDTGKVDDEGKQILENYNFEVPEEVPLRHPFGLAVSQRGGEGDEFPYTGSFLRHVGELRALYYKSKVNNFTGSGLVRLREPWSNPHAAWFPVHGLEPTPDTDAVFLARYSCLAAVQSFFEAGLSELASRVKQLPRLQLLQPTFASELNKPKDIDISWQISWRRWDGNLYAKEYDKKFAEDELDLVYVLLYSRDSGRTWRNVMDDQTQDPGTLPRLDGGSPDPQKSLVDTKIGGMESFRWFAPADRLPEGSYVLRVEAHRRSEPLHYAHHEERIYVSR